MSLSWFAYSFHNSVVLNKYSIKKKQYKTELRNAKKMYYFNKINNNSNKIKETWKIIIKNRGRERSIILISTCELEKH